MTRMPTPWLILLSVLMLAAILVSIRVPILAPHAAAAPGDPRMDEGWDEAPEFLTPDLPPGMREFRVVPLRRVIEIVGTRFRGRVIAAQLTGPLPHERARGVVLVQEVRLLTPDRDVLRIRLDARTGDFLEVAGRGLSKARHKEYHQ